MLAIQLPAFSLEALAAPVPQDVRMSARAGDPTVAGDLTALAFMPPAETFRQLYMLDGNDIKGDITNTGVKCERSIDNTYPGAGLKAGQASFELWDRDNRYSVGGSREAKRGQTFTFQVDFSQTTDTADVWSGVVIDVKVKTAHRVKLLSVVCLGDISRLVPLPADSEVLVGASTGEAVSKVVEDTDVTIIENDVGIIIEYFWGDGSSKAAQLNAIVTTEGGDSALIEPKGGGVEFWERNRHTIVDRGRVSQQSFHDGTGSEGHAYSRPLGIQSPLELLVNESVTSVTPLSLSANLETVWEYGVDINVNDGELADVRARFDTGITEAQVPSVADGDFSIGTGQTEPTVTLSRTSGQSLTITFAAEPAFGGVNISDLRLRGKKITRQATVDVVSQFQDSESQSEFGRQAFSPEVLLGTSVNEAQSLVTGVVRRHSQGLPIAKAAFILSNAEQAKALLDLDLGDRVSVTQDVGHQFNSEAQIVGISHNVYLSGQPHEIVFSCLGASISNEEEMILDDPDQGILDTNRLGA